MYCGMHFILSLSLSLSRSKKLLITMANIDNQKENESKIYFVFNFRSRKKENKHKGKKFQRKKILHTCAQEEQCCGDSARCAREKICFPLHLRLVLVFGALD